MCVQLQKLIARFSVASIREHLGLMLKRVTAQSATYCLTISDDDKRTAVAGTSTGTRGDGGRTKSYLLGTFVGLNKYFVNQCNLNGIWRI